MSVSTQTSAITYIANGSTTQWDFGFPVTLESHLQFKIKDPTGVLSTIPPSAYSVSGIGSPTGGYVVYPLAGNPVTPGWRVRIQRVVPLIQQIDIVNQEAFYPEVIEAGADYSMFALQQMQQQITDLLANDLWD